MFRVRLFLAALVVGSLLLTAAPALAAPPAWGGSGCSQFYVVQPGDNLFRIGLRFGVSTFYLQQLNGIANPNFIFAGQTLCVRGAVAPAPGGFFYRVQPGDTLFSIGARFGWSYFYLAQVNHLPNPNCIFVGQMLFIPFH